MSEIIPPAGPEGQLPPPVPSPPDGPDNPPSRKLCAALGCGVFIVSCLFCLLSPVAFLFGLAAAVISLFFAGYRFLAVGYFLTLGVVLLGSIIYCSTTNFRID
jgi:hypothetical protein